MKLAATRPASLALASGRGRNVTARQFRFPAKFKSSMQISKIVSSCGRKFTAPRRCLGVVVGYDHLQAVRKHDVRAGRNRASGKGLRTDLAGSRSDRSHRPDHAAGRREDHCGWPVWDRRPGGDFQGGSQRAAWWGPLTAGMFSFERFAFRSVKPGNSLGPRRRAEGKLQDLPIILVVEDEEPLQEIVHDTLKEGGFDVTTVARGREAVAMIESGVVNYLS